MYITYLVPCRAHENTLQQEQKFSTNKHNIQKHKKHDPTLSADLKSLSVVFKQKPSYSQCLIQMASNQFGHFGLTQEITKFLFFIKLTEVRVDLLDFCEKLCSMEAKCVAFEQEMMLGFYCVFTRYFFDLRKMILGQVYLTYFRT